MHVLWFMYRSLSHGMHYHDRPIRSQHDQPGRTHLLFCRNDTLRSRREKTGMDQIPSRKGGGQTEIMNTAALVFYGFATLAIGSALLLVSMRNIARSLFLFFIVLFSVAGLYVFALADFVAITEILVYVGGVLVLMLFAFMLSNKELLKDLQRGASHFFALPAWQSAVMAASFLAILIYTSLQLGTDEPAWISAARENGKGLTPTDHTVHPIGVQLMTRYLLPFEMVSVLLMMALIGAAHLTRKEETTP